MTTDRGTDNEAYPWKPRYWVAKDPDVGGAPIPADEPVLVIRAQDQLAPMMLAHYMAKYNRVPDADPKIINDLARHWIALLAWQRANPDRVKTADR